MGIVEIASADPFSSFYVDDRFVLRNGVWIYMETNGLWTDQGPGLHTGDVTNHNLQRAAINWEGDVEESTCVDEGPWDGDLPVF